MNEIRVEFEALKKLEAALAQAPAGAQQELVAGVEDAVARLKFAVIMEAPTPVRDGALRSSINASGAIVVDGLGVESIVGSSLDYAIPVELGTKPHEIRARPGSALSFTWRGREVVVSVVHHPGTKGAFMFEKGLGIAKPDLDRIFVRVEDRIAERIGLGKGAP